MGGTIGFWLLKAWGYIMGLFGFSVGKLFRRDWMEALRETNWKSDLSAAAASAA